MYTLSTKIRVSRFHSCALRFVFFHWTSFDSKNHKDYILADEWIEWWWYRIVLSSNLNIFNIPHIILTLIIIMSIVKARDDVQYELKNDDQKSLAS